MDPDSKKILHLTLEILYLLTGEDYIIVKRSGDHVPPIRKTRISASNPLSEQKILELIQQITELLTGRGSLEDEKEMTCPRPLVSHGMMGIVVFIFLE
ncbi:gastrula zinc finger protein XlCGF53.1-like, partial [Rana temporaria]|uniref:gastrula zinc finger protein XlCGF53.1-like n=1 Tax=Rana temporaria TaxID=8407 RepID=UPI001AAC5761